MAEENPYHFSIDVYDGKYTLVNDDKGFRALRYGEEWRSLVGDKMILSLCQEILKLREAVEASKKKKKKKKKTKKAETFVCARCERTSDGLAYTDPRTPPLSTTPCLCISCVIDATESILDERMEEVDALAARLSDFKNPKGKHAVECDNGACDRYRDRNGNCMLCEEPVCV